MAFRSGLSGQGFVGSAEAADSRFAFVTHRELLASRAMARRAAARGGNRTRSQKLVEDIERELERRKMKRWDRIHADLPPVAALD